MSSRSVNGSSGGRTPVNGSVGGRTPVHGSSGGRTPVHGSVNGRTRVGKYELGRTLGEGNFAKVKWAKHVDTNEVVAIKIIDKEKILKHKMISQIKREISTMKLIRHPNVIRMHEVMASRTKIYIVMEFVTGGELFDKIARSGRMKEDEARKYFQQLICAVDYCHSRGVCHRDLKPENLLLDAIGILKVSDFGLSALPQQVREDGLLHTTCGTPNYVAPEVIHNKGYDGPKADLWSCGVILYVLMAGYLPFEENNLMALYKKIFKAEFTCPPWFSSSAKKLIKRILDPNPATRITIAEVIENEWFKKGYKPPDFEHAEVNLDDVNSIFSDSESMDSENLVVERREEGSVAPVTMNAFELISKSQGLNLSSLFEKQMGLVKRETRFTSKCSANEIVSKIEEAAGPLGFDVKKNNCKLKINGEKTGRKGRLSVATEILEVAPSLYMVEMRKSEGDTLEFHDRSRFRKVYVRRNKAGRQESLHSASNCCNLTASNCCNCCNCLGANCSEENCQVYCAGENQGAKGANCPEVQLPTAPETATWQAPDDWAPTVPGRQ